MARGSARTVSTRCTVSRMADPLSDRDEVAAAMRLIEREAEEYLGSLDDAPARAPGEPTLDDALPEQGVGSLRALSELMAVSVESAVRSSGPRYFHFVTGGVTPAALRADWLTSTLDQMAHNWTASALASRLEQISTGWLKEMFGLPRAWSAAITSGTTIANFVGLAAGRRWFGLQHGVDVDADGLWGVPPVPVFASGYLHASAVKALGMLGLGRDKAQILTRDSEGRIDLIGLRAALSSLGGKPAIVIATAGDVNTGDFDPLREMSQLAREHGAWLHVDGAFGLFAALSPLTRNLVDGVELADSVAVDGHKWLNVVCFRFRPPGLPEAELDELNRRLGAMVLDDGRVYFGTTEYAGKVAFRPAIVNWRTTEKDVDLIVEVVRELGAKLLATAPGR